MDDPLLQDFIGRKGRGAAEKTLNDGGMVDVGNSVTDDPLLRGFIGRKICGDAEETPEASD